MTANMKNFLAKVSEDKALAEKIGKLEKVDELIAAAKAVGIELTETDFVQPENALSEDELTVIQGGVTSTQQEQDWADFNNCPGTNGIQDCFCAAGGGGQRDENGDVCACVGYGQGYRGGQKCICPLVGVGADDEI
ncbi:MAG: Nif11-like leader peptide family RiPP precursor [Clostridia bacterium]|nr:Nif11-like leader peptide family RiPP precursor [Clostridia bacterium]